MLTPKYILIKTLKKYRILAVNIKDPFWKQYYWQKAYKYLHLLKHRDKL